MLSTVITKSYPPPAVNRSEILRYMGASEGTFELNKLIDECLKECLELLTYKICFCEFPVLTDGDIVDFSFAKVRSKALAENLKSSESAFIFAATTGMELDRLIFKYGKLSPAKAFVFQAIGAERAESLCDLFEKKLSDVLNEKKLYLTPRFSPGYKDLSLSFQKDIFRVLDCPRRIGLTLTESLLMSPSKSVTAVTGVSKIRECRENSCLLCNKTDCKFRDVK